MSCEQRVALENAAVLQRYADWLRETRNPQSLFYGWRVEVRWRMVRCW